MRCSGINLQFGNFIEWKKLDRTSLKIEVKFKGWLYVGLKFSYVGMTTHCKVTVRHKVSFYEICHTFGLNSLVYFNNNLGYRNIDEFGLHNICLTEVLFRSCYSHVV